MPRCAEAAEDLLRQPQLAPLLPARHQDPGLRTVGGPRLHRAGQRHRPLRRGVERAGLRASASPNCCAPARSRRMPRIFAAQPENCAPIAARLPGGDRRPRPASARPSRRAPPSPSRSACRSPRRAARKRRRRGDAERGGDRAGHARPRAHAASMSSPPAPRPPPPSAAARAGAIRADETTVVVLTGTGLKATPRIAELLGVTL